MKFVKTVLSLKLAHGFIRGLMILTVLILSSCAGGLSSIYDSNFPLTKEIVKSKSSKLTVKIPQGWFAADENENNLIDLWLIKDDYSATLNFVSLNLDSASVKEIQSDEINGLMKMSQLFRKAKFGKAIKEFTNQEIFELHQKQFAAYDYKDSSGRAIRVAVFKSGNRYYELSAVPVKFENLKELYKIQNSVLSSVE